MQKKIEAQKGQSKVLVVRQIYKHQQLLIVHLLTKKEQARELFCMDIKIYDMRQKQTVFVLKKSFAALKIKARDQEEALQIMVGIFEELEFTGRPETDFGAAFEASMMRNMGNIEAKTQLLKMFDLDEENDEE